MPCCLFLPRKRGKKKKKRKRGAFHSGSIYLPSNCLPIYLYIHMYIDTNWYRYSYIYTYVYMSNKGLTLRSLFLFIILCDPQTVLPFTFFHSSMNNWVSECTEYPLHAQFYVRCKGRCNMYAQLNHFAVHQKLTQHCKSTVLQFKKKRKEIRQSLPSWIFLSSRGNISHNISLSNL